MKENLAPWVRDHVWGLVDEGLEQFWEGEYVFELGNALIFLLIEHFIEGLLHDAFTDSADGRADPMLGFEPHHHGNRHTNLEHLAGPQRSPCHLQHAVVGYVQNLLVRLVGRFFLGWVEGFKFIPDGRSVLVFEQRELIFILRWLQSALRGMRMKAREHPDGSAASLNALDLGE